MNKHKPQNIGVFGAVATALALSACAGDVAGDPAATSGGADGVSVAASPAPTQTSVFALAEFEGYANPATGEFELERVTDLRPLAQIAALYEGNGVRTIGQSLPRSTPAPWCTGRIANDGAIGTNPPDTFELWTDPASIASALPGAAIPSACNVGNTSLYGIDGVFCARVRAMNFYGVDWNDVYTQLYLSTGDAATQGAYAYPFGTGAQTLTDAGDPLPDLVGLPEPGDEFGIWSYGDLDASGGLGTQTWTFRNATTGAFRFRGRVIGRLAENCGTPDVNEDCDPLELGDNACRLYTTGEACTDDLDCESYACTGGVCADGCRAGLWGAQCQNECPGGFADVCNGHGTCSDGRTGTGLCACSSGFHGAACEFSCTDGVRNGAETQTDIGGPCPVPVGGPNEIYYNGYFYRTLDNAPPAAAFGSWINTCQQTPIQVPAGYELAPYDPGVVSAVIAPNIFSTHCVMMSNGLPYGVSNYSNGAACIHGSCSGPTGCISGTAATGYFANLCSLRILIRRNANLAPSCKAIRALDVSAPSGVYAIDPDGDGTGEEVYCDMTTDGGGWTLVSSSNYPVDDLAQGHSTQLSTLSPGSTMSGVWSGMRALVTANSDIRFACTQTLGGAMTVDLSFYNNGMYRDITAGPTDADTCFEEGNGAGYTGPWARRNNITGATTSGPYVHGYLEGEDNCTDPGDFTVDYTERGMDVAHADNTGWGEDDTSIKCGTYGVGAAWFIFVRE